MNLKNFISKFQLSLNAFGENLKVDGIFGPKTEQAASKYEIDVEFFIRKISAPKKIRPIDWARTQLGVAEIPGAKDNSKIVEYHKHSKNLKGYVSDEIPWCSSFLNAAADNCGMFKTDNALAISWKFYGDDVGDAVSEGDIVLIKTDPNGTKFHVTLANGDFSRSSQETFQGLGGNQKNSVCVSTYKTASIVKVVKWKSLA